MPKRINKKRKSKARMVAKKKKQQRSIAPSMEDFFLGMKRIKENYNQLYLW